MKIFPSVIMSDTRSRAERTIFSLIANTEFGEHAMAFHSVNLRHHEYKASGEIDFVVLSPRGLLVLEVKGGGIKCDADGRWRYIDRYGASHHSSEGPFRQAESAMHSLRERLMSDIDVAPLRFGFAVVFPDVEFDVDSVSWDPEIIVDGTKLRGGSRDFATVLRSIHRYWEQRLPQRANADPELLEAVHALLRPRFELVASIAFRADEVERRMETLTAAQFRFIDSTSANKRMICYGGAGTGKTFLLAELARRLVANGERPLVTCQSPTLASYLKGRLPKSVRIMTFEDLVASAASVGFVAADVLLVDEAQDLLTQESLETLDAAVRDGLDHGRWRVFLDDNIQSSLHGNLDPEALAYLESSSASLRLPENCRNTKHVANQTMLLTGGDIGQPLVDEGPPVDYHYFVTDNDQLWQLTQVVSELAEDASSLGQITIISSKPFEESVASQLTGEFAPTPLSAANSVAFPPKMITFASPAEIKGLENRFIIVADLDSAPSDPKGIAELYVGITRARVGLHLFMRRGARPGFEALMRSNYERMKKVEAYNL